MRSVRSAFRRLSVSAQHKIHVIRDSHGIKKSTSLKQVPNPKPYRIQIKGRQFINTLSQHLNRTQIRLDEADYVLQQYALARSGASHDGHRFAASHAQVDPSQNPSPTKCLVQVVDHHHILRIGIRHESQPNSIREIRTSTTLATSTSSELTTTACIAA